MVNLTKKAAAAAGIAEGDYTTWGDEALWVNDFSDNLWGWMSYGTFIDEKNEVLNILWNDENENYRLGIYKLSDFSVVFENPSGTNYPYDTPWHGTHAWEAFGLANIDMCGFTRSLQSYIAFYNTDGVTIEVWRGGSSPLWTHDIGNEVPGLTRGGLEISPSGKWLLAVPRGGAFEGRLVLFEGI